MEAVQEDVEEASYSFSYKFQQVKVFDHGLRSERQPPAPKARNCFQLAV